MIENLINDIQQAMLDVLDNEQLTQLRKVLDYTFRNVDVTEKVASDATADNDTLLKSFLAAKRVEGCSEKSMIYYRTTIETALAKVGKAVRHITTDDLRTYLNDYQQTSGASKVTIDNIRRILSSFFSWLEDENYIIKSPVRRIHKVKVGKTVKETYTDESLEIMRDNCESPRDLAIIDLLASPRFAPTMEWDTAAGHAIAKASGAEIYQVGKEEPLVYNKPDLLNPWFIVKRNNTRNRC